MPIKFFTVIMVTQSVPILDLFASLSAPGVNLRFPLIRSEETQARTVRADCFKIVANSLREDDVSMKCLFNRQMHDLCLSALRASQAPLLRSPLKPRSYLGSLHYCSGRGGMALGGGGLRLMEYLPLTHGRDSGVPITGTQS